jgi:hypothetical protein
MNEEELLDWFETSFRDFCVLLKLKNADFKWEKKDEMAYKQIEKLITTQKSGEINE